MYDTVFVARWPWWVAGPAIGLVVTLFAWLLGKSLGVSTGYGVACAMGSRLTGDAVEVPGTSLVQVGEGKLLAVFTVAGIVPGTYAFARLRSAGASGDLTRSAHPASS